ncbi:uncharacterized protein LAESUDRAFT_664574 [Laetiporus sulphureus 93-53]|uniref:Splicing arginine serine-rich 12 n=1 Tax=Laetiporus sulphureus 93-53 TaxID=1314785 RepID=A0A165BJF0_9APHY|nr:uncharacterized protein LAESUDRAFT_664574 [Laetiporus sulphureus 93-53]KZT01172.1 hypothetical protein LAESUDRAFT_664574 [Laetiporus sulphureus 93-53]
MPSHRHRSYSRERSRSRERDHSRSRSPERRIDLPSGASPISESDYFLKSDEFRLWLKDEKDKYFDELSSDKARKYFRKFVKAWNRGKLPKSMYAGIDIPSASSQTAYRWSFASKTSQADSVALRAARDEVGAATYKRPMRSDQPSSSSRSGRIQGPTLPSQSDLTLAREAEEEHRAAERDYNRKRERKETKERVEEVVGPKEVGREGMLEKKRAQREGNRAFRERGDEGLELDESTLMGGGDSFKERIARREASRKRFEEKRHGAGDERLTAARERADAIRQKDKATMDMFMQLAKDKFG